MRWQGSRPGDRTVNSGVPTVEVARYAEGRMDVTRA